MKAYAHIRLIEWDRYPITEEELAQIARKEQFEFPPQLTAILIHDNGGRTIDDLEIKISETLTLPVTGFVSFSLSKTPRVHFTSPTQAFLPFAKCYDSEFCIALQSSNKGQIFYHDNDEAHSDPDKTYRPKFELIYSDLHSFLSSITIEQKIDISTINEHLERAKKTLDAGGNLSDDIIFIAWGIDSCVNPEQRVEAIRYLFALGIYPDPEYRTDDWRTIIRQSGNKKTLRFFKEEFKFSEPLLEFINSRLNLL